MVSHISGPGLRMRSPVTRPPPTGPVGLVTSSVPILLLDTGSLIYLLTHPYIEEYSKYLPEQHVFEHHRPGFLMKTLVGVDVSVIELRSDRDKIIQQLQRRVNDIITACPQCRIQATCC